MSPLITALYVPGDRPDRFPKAVAAGADAVILDLEDAVPADRKAFAREAVAEWLAAPSTVDAAPRLQVRINEGAQEAAADLEMLRPLSELVGFEVRVPKVEGLARLDALVAELPGVPLVALVESALGLEHAGRIAAHPAVSALGLGESDLASDLGVRSQPVLDHARLRLLIAARAAGLPAPMLSVYPGIRDLDGLRADTERGRELGLVGRAAVHPSQLPVIAEVFAPSADEVAWSEEVVAAMQRSGGGATTLANGELVDPAMLGRARALLARRPG